MGQSKRLLSLAASLVLLSSCVPSAAASRRTYSSDQHSATIQKFVEPLAKPIPHVLQGVAVSEITLLISRRMPQLISLARQLFPRLLRRFPMLPALVASMPATSAIIATNTIVFAIWRLAITSQSGNLVNGMQNNFIMPYNPYERQIRPYTVLTSGFSHIDAQHLVSNMVALLTFGKQPEKWLGARKFVYMYISSIYGSTLLNMATFQKLLGRSNQGRVSGSLGASGAISALQAYFCLRFPTTNFQVGGNNALPAPLACVFWYVTELMQLGRERQTGIGHGAHLAGYTFGALFFLLSDIVLAPKRQRNKAIRQLLQVLQRR